MTPTFNQPEGAQLALPSVETTGTILQVYNELAAGKILSMEFSSLKDAESFRVMIHQYKSKQEDAIKSIGMEMEPTSFSFQCVSAMGYPIKLTQEDLDIDKSFDGQFCRSKRFFKLAFKSKLPARTYKFTDITGQKSEA